MSLPNIKIGQFDGPFDLLLHLIKQNKMDIYDIKIYEITKQYLDYINKMKEFDMEIASEFIVVAATLLEIKSKTLLPKPKLEEVEEDPRKDLVERLLEYKLFKEAAGYFEEQSLYAGTIYPKKPEVIDDSKFDNKSDFINDKTILDLYSLYCKMVEEYKKKQNTTNVIEKRIPVDKYKIEDKYNVILNKLHRKRNFFFYELASQCECKMEVIVTFLALLELIKQRSIEIIQSENFENIIIERVETDGQD
ncbi:MAG: segregation/condensation protein A [Inconstantimicrobium porci]|uniref:Segregation and condensation protein A n=1 Tax=Inconstantimicrobium porci TaxID=2652291 RepID=A0A7X2MVX1_9CLOT|nr:segregation/condensation protein A [Inconstantimicrobium porci]MDD6771868.1 segregation/condensation protein A [Inconstantimicrobium porci]MDY5913431.1 segregation/condensation protein A [Inconstantimicrobium porci]MSR90058.1 segregation/condensation protein A [Inconstantimicrobium porci]